MQARKEKNFNKDFLVVIFDSVYNKTKNVKQKSSAVLVRTAFFLHFSCGHGIIFL